MEEIREINENIRLGLLDLKAFSQQLPNAGKRELEKAGTLHLLKHLLKTGPISLAYSPERKPYLENRSEHISISHSHDKLVIIVNKREATGVDVELIRDKIVNVQHKFLSEAELRSTANNVDKLLTYWAAKEALYKVYGLKEVEFRTHLFVEETDQGFLRGRIALKDIEKNYRLVAETLDHYKLVYVLHEI